MLNENVSQGSLHHTLFILTAPFIISQVQVQLSIPPVPILDPLRSEHILRAAQEVSLQGIFLMAALNFHAQGIQTIPIVPVHKLICPIL